MANGNYDPITGNAEVQGEAESGAASVTAGSASGSTGQVGSTVGSDRIDRSFIATTTDTDVGSAEAQKRGVAADSNYSSNHQQTLQQLSVQSLQNAIETANMVSKQALRHGDVAIDKQWNINETDFIAAGAIPNQQAFIDLMAKAIGDALTR